MPEPAPAVDLSKFTSPLPAGVVIGFSSRFTGMQELFALAQIGHGLDPRAVPVEALRLMGTHPAVYLAERTLTGIIRRPDLYSVKHAKPAIAAEAEAWLWPILDDVLAGAARGFSYGTVGQVLDWAREPLYYEVAKPGKKARRKTSPAHTHYVRAVELHPDSTNARADVHGRFDGIDHFSGSYNRARTILWSWDPEFGELVGQGARRRAWRAYCESLIISLLRNKYLERSVDAPKIAWCPAGTVEVDGVTYQISDYVTKLLLELQGAGAIGLPGARDANGKLYEVESMEVNEAAAEIFEKALNRCDAQIMLAYLLAPSMGGVDDAGGGAAGRALDGMLREQVEDVATFAARGLTTLLDTVHRANYDPAKESAPWAVATDVGKAAARRVFQSVLQLVNAGAGGEIALRTDVPALLDKLGVPVRDVAPPEAMGGDGPGRGPGRPLDTASDREDRREDAETDDGGEDTGGDDVERDEQREDD